MGKIEKIRAAGYTVRLHGDHQIAVEPAKTLSAEQWHYLKAHRTEIIEELKGEAANDPATNTYRPKPAPNGKWVTCWTPDGAPLRVYAVDPEHAAWLRRVNPRTAV